MTSTKVHIIVARWTDGFVEIVAVFDNIDLARSRLRVLRKTVPLSDPYSLETHEVIHE